jgi:hypothetical protein
MKYNDVSKSIRGIAEKTLTQNDLAHRVIIQKGKTYQAYNDYIIEETEFGWQVTIEEADDIKYFNTAKVALAWCIAHKVRKYGLAKTIEVLDSKVISKQLDVDILTQRLGGKLPENCDRATLLARLTEDIHARQDYKKQLSKCVESAKYIKITGSNSNELNRFNKPSKFRRGRKDN